MGKDLPGRAGEGNPAVVDHHQPVHRPGHFLHGVGNDDDSGVFGRVIVVDVAQNRRHANWVQAGGGLVQYEHGGLHGNNAGDGDPALLSAGQLEGGFFQHVLPQPNKLGGLAHPAVDLPLVQPHVFGAEGDILIDGLLKELVLRVLKHQSHLEAGLAGALLALPDIPALEEDAAGGGLEQPVEVLDEGGFARAGVADDAQVLPAVGGKVHVHQGPVFKGGTGGIDVAQALRLNDRFQWLHSFIIWCMPAGHARVCSRSKSAWAHSSSLSASRGTSTPACRSCHSSSVVSGTVRPTAFNSSTR